ncbi:MAG: glycosyltransferase family 39 protein [Bacteroidales bacterium]|nr:glycosyltransferase family 39 protein [Bacteroidales bacterium]MCF8404604.1 glycosyltransferase family 39 protein [Bacteroidales bacterium]
MKKDTIYDKLLLGFIVLVGIVLRFYNYSGLPYTFDEFSALFRTRFDNFNDLIHLGVVTSDTHPAGVQVFMYFWIKVFGESEMVVKLPFMLMGVASIYLVYRIGREWFNPTVGLIAAMFLAFLQYPITYSQYARPYSSGLFLGLCMVFFWSKAFFIRPQDQKKYVLWYILFGALNAYNHHFSLFFLGLVWLSGIFFIKKNQLKWYLIAGISMFALYLPHLKIFFIQLGKGGVESWLSKPDSTFFLKYLQYVLHYDLLLYSVAGAMFLLAVFFRSGIVAGQNKFRIMMLSWLGITYGVAYLYSIYVNAVLQYSVILFVFPFLIILVFSWIRDLKLPVKIIILVVFGITSIYSLIVGRQHYFIQYNSGYRETLVEADKTDREFGTKKVTTLVYLPEKIKDYYIRQLQLDERNYLSLDSIMEFDKFQKFVRNLDTEYLTLAYSGLHDLEYYSMIKDVFPFIIAKKTWYLGDMYVFSKKALRYRSVNPEEIVYHYENKFESPGNEILISEGADSALTQWNGIKISPEETFFNLLEVNLDTLINHRNNYIFIVLNIQNPGVNLPSASLVTEMYFGQQQLDWRAAEFNHFAELPDHQMTIHKAIKLPDMKFNPKLATLKVYLWNKNADTFYLQDFRLEVSRGNQMIYGLLDPISY